MQFYSYLKLFMLNNIYAKLDFFNVKPNNSLFKDQIYF